MEKRPFSWLPSVIQYSSQENPQCWKTWKGSRQITCNIFPISAWSNTEEESIFDVVVKDLDVKSAGKKRGGLLKGGGGLQEYQAMPFLRDIAHDGWLCHRVLTPPPSYRRTEGR